MVKEASRWKLLLYIFWQVLGTVPNGQFVYGNPLLGRVREFAFINLSYVVPTIPDGLIQEQWHSWK